MANKMNNKKATVNFNVIGDVKSGDYTLEWTYNDAAIVRFGKGAGQRLNIGTAYLLANKDERSFMVESFGRGVVRRGLLVLAKSRSARDDDREKAADLALSLQSKVKVAAAA